MVSVWSSVGKTGKTVLAYLLALKLSDFTDNKIRILLCCAGGKSGELRRIFSSTPPLVEMEDIVNIGAVSAGERLNLYGMLTRRNNVYFIGSLRSGPAFISRYSDAYRSLAHEFKSIFDLVIVDMPSGPEPENLLGRLLLEESDCVVNLLPQDPSLLEGKLFKTGREAFWILNRVEDVTQVMEEPEKVYDVDRLFILPYCGRLAELHRKKALNSYAFLETEFNSALGGIARELAFELGLAADGLKEPGVEETGLAGTGLVAEGYEEAELEEKGHKVAAGKSRKASVALLGGIR